MPVEVKLKTSNDTQNYVTVVKVNVHSLHEGPYVHKLLYTGFTHKAMHSRPTAGPRCDYRWASVGPANVSAVVGMTPFYESCLHSQMQNSSEHKNAGEDCNVAFHVLHSLYST